MADLAKGTCGSTLVDVSWWIVNDSMHGVVVGNGHRT